jgi:predicted chitinase
MIHLVRDILFAKHRDAFGKLTQSQVDGLNALADGMETDPLLTDPRHAAYMLATAWHETAFTLLPVVERGSKSYFNRYDPVLAEKKQHRDRARRMGNIYEGDGWRYRGRGYVQLTWANNYRHAGVVLNADLIGNPDLALQPGIAYRIMSSGMIEGWFTGKKLADYINASRTDFVQARRVINGLDRAEDIAVYAERYLDIVKAAIVAPSTPAVSPAPEPIKPARMSISQLPIVHDSTSIRALQRALGVNADGIIGPKTYRAILERAE